MTRFTPLCWLLLSFALGIIINLNHQAIALILLVPLLMILFFLSQAKSRPIILSLLLFAMLGWVRASTFASLENFQGKNLTISGIVETKNQKSSVLSERISFKNKHFPVEGKVYVRLPLKSGDRVVLRGKLIKLNENYFALSEPVVLERSCPWQSKLLEKIKRETVSFFKQNFPPMEANLLISSLLGRIETELTLSELFRKAGVSHLLAVSGLHIGFVFVFLFYLFSFLPRLPRYFTCFLFVFFYAGLTGFAPSALRASLMLIIGFLTLESGRSQHLLNNLSLTCFIILFFRPLFLLNTSFQLSALAVAGIALFKPLLDKFTAIYPEGLKNMVTLTLSAQLAVLPLTLIKFEGFPPVSFFSNLIIVPLFSILLPLALISAALHFLSTYLCFPLLPLLFFLSRAILFFARFFSFFPAFPKAIAPAALLIFPPLLVFITLWKEKVRKVNLFTLICLFLLLLSALFWYHSLASYFRPATVTFLNVGQGDACLIQLPRGQNLLIDGGGSSALLLKILNSFSIQKIDAVILSHPHHDHLGGLQNLAGVLRVHSFFSQSYPRSPQLKKLLFELRQAGVKTYTIKKRTFSFPTEGKLEFIPVYIDANPNESPLTLLFKTGEFSFLFPGDAEKEAQTWLVNRLRPVTVLKLPHHGGYLLPDFLKKVKPKIGIISSGKNNRYGHPKKEVISLLKRNKVRFYRTDKNGWISIRKEGKYLVITSEFSGNQ